MRTPEEITRDLETLKSTILLVENAPINAVTSERLRRLWAQETKLWKERENTRNVHLDTNVPGEPNDA